MNSPFEAHRIDEIARAPSGIAWCDEQNRKYITRKLGRWYYVGDVDGVDTTIVLDGTDGENVHRLLDGNLVDFYRWPESRMKGYRKWLQSCADRGLIEHRKAA